VDLPEEWEAFSVDAKVNYLSTVMDRGELLRRVGKTAGIPEYEIGKQSIHKAGLAHLVVALTEDGHGE
jgi:hypothetical protein